MRSSSFFFLMAKCNPRLKIFKPYCCGNGRRLDDKKEKDDQLSFTVFINPFTLLFYVKVVTVAFLYTWTDHCTESAKKMCMWVKRCWNNEFIFQILCTDSWKTHQLKLNRKNTSVLTVREDGRQHFINSIQWKQSLATRNLKAIFLVEWQGNMRSLYSKDKKNQNKKTHYNY